MNRHISLFFIILGITLISIGCKNNATGPDGGSEPEPDKDGPVITFVNPSIGGVISGTIDIAGVAEDSSDLQLVEVSIDGDPWVTSSPPVTITGHYWAYTVDTLVELTEGAHTVEARATDANSNLGAMASLNFTVDHNYPNVQITSPSLAELIRGTIDISGTSSGTGGIIILSVKVDPNEGGQYFAAAGTTSWIYSGFDTTTLSDGSYIMRAVAEADNFNTSIVNIGVIVDNTDPSVAITSHADGEAVSGLITLQGTAGDAVGVDRVEIKIDSPPNDLVMGTTSWSYPIDTTDPTYGGEGQHIVTIIATDTAGNFTQQSISLYFDQTPPAITINIPPSPAANSYLNGSQTIEGTVANMLGTDDMEISFNGGSYGTVDNFDGSNWSHTFDTGVELPGDGQLTVSLRATDLISAASDVKTITYYVDNTPPTGEITSPADGAFVAGTVFITGAAGDNLALADTNSVTIVITDGTSTDNNSGNPLVVTGGLWSHSWDSTLFGSSTITVTITDKAGNIYQPSISVNKDTNLPSITVSSPSGGSFQSDTVTISGTAQDILSPGTNEGVKKVEVQIVQSGQIPQEADYNAHVAYEDLAAPYDTALINWTYNNYDTTGFNGSYDVYARVTDGDDNTNSVPIGVIVDTTPPVVSIDYPTSANTGDTNFLYSTVNASGTATDVNLDTVEVQVDAQTPVAPTGTSSWSYSWDTAAYPTAQNGTAFKVTVTDLAGNTGTATVNVDVRPKITSLSVDTELIDKSITINGFNFATSTTPVTSIDVVFQPGTGTETINTQSTDGITLTVSIPSTATSGDVYVTENGINSNTAHLDVWEYKLVATGKATQQALAISGTNTYQAIYNGGNIKELWFSKNAAAASSIDATSTSIGHNPSIAVYNNGIQDEVYIVYIEATNDDLRFIKSINSGTSFSASVLVDNAVSNSATSITFDPNTPATLGITYQSITGDLMYVESSNSGATWGTGTPPKNGIVETGTNMGQYSSLAFDPSGTPCIVYYDGDTQKVKFAYYTGVFWSTDFIENTLFQGEFPSIKVDSGGGIHVSYYNANSGDLKYAYASSRSSSFTVTTVDSDGITGYHTALALDGSSNPHISYVNFNYKNIRYACYDGTSWNLLVTPAAPASIPTAVTQPPEAGTGIGIGSDGYTYIGYIDSTKTNVHQIIYRPKE